MQSRWKETKGLLRTLTPYKIWNAAQIYLSYRLSIATGRVIHWGAPVSLGVEPTTACNLRCPQCLCGQRAFTRPTGRANLTDFKRLINETKESLIYLILYFQGEPYLNPDFLAMAEYATQAGIYTMSSTNAHFLTPETARRTIESGLSKLIISLDGITQENYEKYRVEGSIEKVFAGIKNLVSAKHAARAQTPFIEVQFIVFAHNENEISELKKISKELGIDKLALKTAQVYDYEAEGSSLIPKNKKYSRYVLDQNGIYRPAFSVPNKCKKMWQGAEITWDGRVVPCCFDKDARYEMGKLSNEVSFTKIWKESSAYQVFRKQIITQRGAIEMCRNCTEGVKVNV